MSTESERVLRYKRRGVVQDSSARLLENRVLGIPGKENKYAGSGQHSCSSISCFPSPFIIVNITSVPGHSCGRYRTMGTMAVGPTIAPSLKPRILVLVKLKAGSGNFVCNADVTAARPAGHTGALIRHLLVHCRLHRHSPPVQPHHHLSPSTLAPLVGACSGRPFAHPRLC